MLDSPLLSPQLRELVIKWRDEAVADAVKETEETIRKEKRKGG